jgi:hypothetical protein
MEGDLAGPLRPGVENRLEPGFCLVAGVCEDQRGAGLRDGVEDLWQHLQAHMPGPGEALNLLGNERVDDNLFGNEPLHELTGDGLPLVVNAE